MDKITIRIKGNPIAKMRHRSFQRGKFKGTYNPQQSEEGRWLTEALMQIPKHDGPIFKKGVPVIVTVIFAFERPKSHYGIGKNSDKLKPSAPMQHTYKPDTSNLCKFFEDCLNNHAWHDDSQIISLRASKAWDRTGWTEIVIRRGLP